MPHAKRKRHLMLEEEASPFPSDGKYLLGVPSGATRGRKQRGNDTYHLEPIRGQNGSNHRPHYTHVEVNAIGPTVSTLPSPDSATPTHSDIPTCPSRQLQALFSTTAPRQHRVLAQAPILFVPGILVARGRTNRSPDIHTDAAGLVTTARGAGLLWPHESRRCSQTLPRRHLRGLAQGHDTNNNSSPRRPQQRTPDEGHRGLPHRC